MTIGRKTHKDRPTRPRVAPDLDALKDAEPREWLRAAIAATGRTQAAFARGYLVRDPRTVEQWLGGRYPMPRTVLEKVQAIVRGAGRQFRKDGTVRKRARPVAGPDGRLDPALARGIARANPQARADLAAALLGKQPHTLATRSAVLSVIQASARAQAEKRAAAKRADSLRHRRTPAPPPPDDAA